MKKLSALLLALAIILSLAALAGCGKTEEKPAATQAPAAAPAPTAAPAPAAPAAPADTGKDTKETLKNSKPNEYIQEKLDAGMEVIFGYAAIADNFFTNEILGGGIQKYVESIGMKYNFQAADENVATLITQVENFAQMGAAICCILPPDGNSVKDAVLKAQEKGTTCIVWGTNANYETICANYDNPEFGKAIGGMAVAWTEQHFKNAAAGSVKTAFQYQTAVVDVIDRKNAIFDQLNACPAIKVVYEVDDPTNTLDCGYTHAEEAFTIAPDLKLFIWIDNSSCVGGNNYVFSRPDLDKANIGFFCGGINDVLPELIEQSKTNASVIRGTIQDGDSTADSTVVAIKAIIAGEITLPYYAYQPMFSKVAGFDYSYDSRTA